MKKTVLLFGLLLLGINMAQAQNRLYETANIKQAYQNDTRARDGAPGPDYWQNHGTYNINLRINPPNPTVHGSEQITYHNNSPDTLQSLVFKLFMNNHKPGAVRQSPVDESYLTGGVHIDKFTVDGSDQAWKDRGAATSVPQKLPQVLAPGDSVQLAIDWHYKLAKRAGREGQIDSTSYYVAYFYPRVAVYDDYNGWDKMDFTGNQEFYSDFNNYSVQVTVPKNYIVWGTGTLQNTGDVLQDGALERFNQSKKSDKTIIIARPEQVQSGEITAQNKTNTWKFESSNIPDVAFGLSNHFEWDAASVLVDDKTQRRAGVQAAYNDSAADFHQMVQFGRNALGWFSHHWPGVAYPYAKTTIFQGGADMEYPMMVNDSSTPDPVFSRFVAEHEIAHTYFPFYMGTNETRYAFMDEGWATTLELLIGYHDQGREKANALYRQFRVKRWINDDKAIGEIPIIAPSNMLKRPAYSSNAYGKASLGYLAMKDLLGDTLFKKCLQTYMDRWHGKHPSPWDFFYTFNDVSGRNLNWFWKSWFFDTSYIDTKIEKVQHHEDGFSLSLKNIGGMPAPVDVVVNYQDGSSKIYHQTPAIWKANPHQTTVDITTAKQVSSVELDGGLWVDADKSNNSWSK